MSWQNGRYISVDGIFSEVVHKKGNIYKIKSLNSFKETYLITNGYFHAHGENLKNAKEDLQFKIISEKLKKDPINENTEFTVMYYRTLTGACDLGCRQFMDENNIKYKIEGGKTVELQPILAKDLLIILEKSKPYGYSKFKELITF